MPRSQHGRPEATEAAVIAAPKENVRSPALERTARLFGRGGAASLQRALARALLHPGQAPQLLLHLKLLAGEAATAYLRQRLRLPALRIQGVTSE